MYQISIYKIYNQIFSVEFLLKRKNVVQYSYCAKWDWFLLAWKNLLRPVSSYKYSSIITHSLTRQSPNLKERKEAENWLLEFRRVKSSIAHPEKLSALRFILENSPDLNTQFQASLALKEILSSLLFRSSVDSFELVESAKHFILGHLNTHISYQLQKALKMNFSL